MSLEDIWLQGGRDQATSDVALPGGLAACRQLTWLKMESDARSPVLGRLHSLRFLHVRPTGRLPHEMHWTRLTALRDLELDLCGIRTAISPGLAGMTGLRELEITGAKTICLKSYIIHFSPKP